MIYQGTKTSSENPYHKAFQDGLLEYWYKENENSLINLFWDIWYKKYLEMLMNIERSQNKSRECTWHW